MVSNFFNTLYLRYRSSGASAVFSPRKPRHPLLRLLVGLVGLALLAVLLVFGVVIGLAMLGAGLAMRLLPRRPRAAPARRRGALDGEFRVVDRPLLR
ncbi:hypothetical protein QFW77_12895 [Luteimonas sp. RD2P54]|uniref:Transmembrane protein n=1 Tax=Luteimonas endophytica TaxID=3042023 RepID=A0ABT6JAL7_9GAMM|nr:hypothetical protein [Luteimonas endophytica]MDH5823875.1 hypothetical protein [Luteimonas endophytica]